MEYRVRKKAGDTITECLTAKSIIIELTPHTEIIIMQTDDGLEIQKHCHNGDSSRLNITPEMGNCIIIK